MSWSTIARAAYVLVIAAFSSAIVRSAIVRPPPRKPAVGGARSVPRDTQLVAIFFGSPECSFSSDPLLQRMVREILIALGNQADRRGWRFASVGVAITDDARSGLRLLERIAPFDEVSSGGSWFNEIAIQYFYRQLPGPPGTPQFVVVRRVATGPSSMQPVGRVERDLLLTRRVGMQEIRAFHSVGAQLPQEGGNTVQRAVAVP